MYKFANKICANTFNVFVHIAVDFAVVVSPKCNGKIQFWEEWIWNINFGNFVLGIMGANAPKVVLRVAASCPRVTPTPARARRARSKSSESPVLVPPRRAAPRSELQHSCGQQRPRVVLPCRAWKDQLTRMVFDSFFGQHLFSRAFTFRILWRSVILLIVNFQLSQKNFF